MSKLSMWLPPFSPDYSGASAVLFDLNTVTAMHDASGCTGNYTGYDDPRWYGSKSGIFCSGLREIDAILGDDEKLENKMISAAKKLDPDILAIVGSPVPMVIGSDLEGIAKELEVKTGLPSFGFDTTGLSLYDEGAVKVSKALIDRFAEECPPDQVSCNRVNVIGALPMDFARGEEIALLKGMLADAGYETGLTLAMGYKLDDIRKLTYSSVNLAISKFGYRICRYLEDKFGMPYLCGFPAGEKAGEMWLERIAQVIGSGKSEIIYPPDTKDDLDTLIIGEQVMCNAIRLGLIHDEGRSGIITGSLYGQVKELSCEGDIDLPDERSIKKAVNDDRIKTIIADPLIEELIKNKNEKEFIPFSQYAVSSKIGLKSKINITGKNFNSWRRRTNEI